MLWFGWYGFNAGSELRVDAVTASAFLNTDIAASFAAIAWLLVEWARGRQPKFIGLLTGAVAGLATITPCAGYVSPTTAVIVGVAAGVVCYFAVTLKNQLGWDDALDVWGVHGVGGFLGIVLLGVFASTLWNPNGADGLLRGNPCVSRQAVRRRSRCAAPGRSVFTYAMLWLINLVTPRQGRRGRCRRAGLDVHLHGEEAYPLGV